MVRGWGGDVANGKWQVAGFRLPKRLNNCTYSIIYPPTTIMLFFLQLFQHSMDA